MKTAKAGIYKVTGLQSAAAEDFLVTEEPLEIRLGFEKEGVMRQKSISVTMRTPGEDEELALGFLFTEGIIAGFGPVLRVSRPPVRKAQARGNVLLVELAAGIRVPLKKLERHFYATSSCGVCGKASIEAIEAQSSFDISDNPLRVSPEILHSLPEKLMAQQEVFGSTGGLHAAALFDPSGKLIFLREDVGRHNALDKLVGASLQKSMLPLSDFLVMVSGRIGFELVQKSVMAGVPLLAAVGAPTSLAVQLAQEAGMTLVGFLRNGQFNIYAGEERVQRAGDTCRPGRERQVPAELQNGGKKKEETTTFPKRL